MIIPPTGPFPMLTETTLDSIVFFYTNQSKRCVFVVFLVFGGFPGFFKTINFTGQRSFGKTKKTRNKTETHTKHSVVVGFGQTPCFCLYKYFTIDKDFPFYKNFSV